MRRRGSELLSGCNRDRGCHAGRGRRLTSGTRESRRSSSSARQKLCGRARMRSRETRNWVQQYLSARAVTWPLRRCGYHENGLGGAEGCPARVGCADSEARSVVVARQQVSWWRGNKCRGGELPRVGTGWGHYDSRIMGGLGGVPRIGRKLRAQPCTCTHTRTGWTARGEWRRGGRGGLTT